MKLLVSLCLCTFMLSKLSSQTHHLGLNFGINQILSTDNEPPFGKGSPWKSDIGYGFDFSYQYLFKNGFLIGLSSTALNLRFRIEEQTLFVENEKILVTTDEILQHHIFSQSLWIGCKWHISNHINLSVLAGFGRQFYYREVYYLKGYPSTKSVSTLEWGLIEKFNHLHVGINPSYTLVHNWNYRINLTTSLRAAYVIDYLNFKPAINRLLPQAFLGLELELGRRKR